MRKWLLFGLTLSMLSGCAKKEDVIKIGEYGGLTGSTATFGISTKNGIDMATEEINAAGGLLGKKVQVIVEDDRSLAEEAASAVKKLVTQDKVVAVLGEVASTRSLAGAPICQENNIPMVTPSSTNPKVTEVGNYIFRVCFIDPFQGEAMAKFAFDNLKVKKAAILKDGKSDYSVGLGQYFAETFQKLGGQIVADESYFEGDQDFKAQLTSIKGKRPEAIFIPGYYTEVGLIARQARELGLNIPLLGGDGWDSPKLTEIATLKKPGDALKDCYFSNHYAADDPNPVIQDYIKKYKAKYGEVPDAMAVLGYDAAHILYDAIKRAGSTEGAKVRDALAQTRDFPGVAGQTTIDSVRNARKPLVVLKIAEGGKYEYTATVNP
ncbi:MAG: ABC transporter substrate-binding protein [candidate division Zixibacteria bacterium]|nr:ABC transporter substrate-binding protein [candidate division Zixibacteria bacterium]MCI0595384.1 ABC transporter substrate-binding protein [candidate division Zixibacteria bacterium]